MQWSRDCEAFEESLTIAEGYRCHAPMSDLKSDPGTFGVYEIKTHGWSSHLTTADVPCRGGPRPDKVH